MYSAHASAAAADVEHACAEACLRVEKRTRMHCDTLHNGTLG